MLGTAPLPIGPLRASCRVCCGWAAVRYRSPSAELRSALQAAAVTWPPPSSAELLARDFERFDEPVLTPSDAQ